MVLPERVDVEITVIVQLQRACTTEIPVRRRLSNGPRRGYSQKDYSLWLSGRNVRIIP